MPSVPDSISREAELEEEVEKLTVLADRLARRLKDTAIAYHALKGHNSLWSDCGHPYCDDNRNALTGEARKTES